MWPCLLFVWRACATGWFGKQSRTPTFYDDSIEKWASMRSERVSLREMVSFGLRAQTQPRLALKSATFLLQVGACTEGVSCRLLRSMKMMTSMWETKCSCLACRNFLSASLLVYLIYTSSRTSLLPIHTSRRSMMRTTQPSTRFARNG